MASIMPPIPRYFFLYGEPCLIFFGGALSPVLSPQNILQMLPPHLAGRGTTDPNPTPLEHLLGLQSAVLMFMIAMITVVVMLYSTEPKVVRGYVLASAITDIPHWSAFFYVLGWEGLAAWRTWDAMLWMQLLFPVFTFAIKWGYLLGLFGGDRVVKKESDARKEK